MPLISESYDSLPYIDSSLTESERLKATKLIEAELAPNYRTTSHPRLDELPESRFSHLIQREIDRKSQGLPLERGIDSSRYEAPVKPSDDSDETAWGAALQQAYRSTSYVSGRQINLELLDEYGRNAWVIGKSQLEDELKELEKDLVVLRKETENVNKARKVAQENAKGELDSLEDAWKRGIGKIIEVQVATDGLRRAILESRRANV